MGAGGPAIVMPLYPNGSILDYVIVNSGGDKFNLADQLAVALAYIHSKGKVHGNVYPVSPFHRQSRARSQ